MTRQSRDAAIRRFHQQMHERPSPSLARELMTEDAVLDFPQSGERFRGVDAIYRSFVEYPGREQIDVDLASIRITGDAERWAMSPMFTVVSVTGGEDELVVRSRGRYPDGSRWWVIEYFTWRGDKVCRGEVFFAPDFEAPSWRASFAEHNPVAGDDGRLPEARP